MGKFHVVQLFSVFLTRSPSREVEAGMVPKEREVKQYASDMDSNTCSDIEIGTTRLVFTNAFYCTSRKNLNNTKLEVFHSRDWHAVQWIYFWAVLLTRFSFLFNLQWIPWLRHRVLLVLPASSIKKPDVSYHAFSSSEIVNGSFLPAEEGDYQGLGRAYARPQIP